MLSLRRLFPGRAPVEAEVPAPPPPVPDAWGLLGAAPASSPPATEAFQPLRLMQYAPPTPVRPARDLEPPEMGTAPLSVFAPEELPAFASLEALAAALAASDGPDGTFVHAPPTPIDMVPAGMERGRTLFGVAPPHPIFTGTRGQMRGVSLSVLHDAVVSGQSTSVHSVARGLYGPSVTLVTGPGGSLATLAQLEPFYAADPDGRVRADIGPERPPPAFRDEIVMPVCGVGFPNYGHFLYDGVPAALLCRLLLPELPIRLVGNVLRPWQRDLLRDLGLLDSYREVVQPVRFSRVLATDLVALHVSYPSRFVRPVFDMLRFRVGGPSVPRHRIAFFSRAGDTTRRVLVNRAEVEAALAAEGVEVVQPELLSIREQVALAASCRFVIGEAGAAMANVGFCDPGTAVLEIQHELGPDGWTRSACRMLGLDWHLYSAADDPDALARHPEPKPHAVFRIDVPSLIEAVRTIRATL